MSALAGYPRISTFFWFNNNAEEATDFYISIFKNSRRLDTVYGQSLLGKPAPIMTISFELDGVPFTALNGGPAFKFTEAMSLVVRCDSQEEIDHFYPALLAGGGVEVQCGWLKDRFGIAWQVVPAVLPDLVKHPNALNAMMRMKKLNIAELERAANT